MNTENFKIYCYCNNNASVYGGCCNMNNIRPTPVSEVETRAKRLKKGGTFILLKLNS